MDLDFKKTDIAFYTVFTGANINVANVIREPPSRFYDCFYFTNNMETYNRLQHTGWIRVYIDEPVKNDEVKDCFDCKMYKTCPHIINELKPYEFTVYIDSKQRIKSDNEILEVIRNLPSSTKICMCAHLSISQPNALQKELDLSMLQPRYYGQKENYIEYINSRLKDFPEDPKHHLMGLFAIRRHNDPVTHAFNEAWFKEINRCGIQDQISLYFVQQMFPDSIQIFDHNVIGVTAEW